MTGFILNNVHALKNHVYIIRDHSTNFMGLDEEDDETDTGFCIECAIHVLEQENELSISKTQILKRLIEVCNIN